MTAVYAVALIVGILATIAWVASVAVAESVPGWKHVDPDHRFGARGRMLVGGLSGFGLAGMSASFAGWPSVAAFAGAIAGATGVAAIARRLGPAVPLDEA